MVWYQPMFFWVSLGAVAVTVFASLSSIFMERELSGSDDLPFECGVESFYTPLRVPACLHFFMVAIIFLIFDIEFVITVALLLSSASWVVMQLVWVFVLSILFLGLVVELLMGSLDWKE